MFRYLGILLVMFAALAGAAAWFVRTELLRPVTPPPSTVVCVPAGASLRQVAEQFHEAGVLPYPKLLLAWARYMGKDREIRSGTYRIEEPVSPIGLLDLLCRGPVEESRWVTIPEGYTVRDIGRILEQAGFGGRDLFARITTDPEFLQQLGLPGSGVEGYLFPDTYAFEQRADLEDIVRTMVRRFRQVSGELTELREAAHMTIEEMVILASIIEKETGKAEERKLISGVFHNRLRIGMPLQSDPTVIYGLKDFNGNLTRADLKHPSPYNTYMNRGLPPGPICNPGRAALDAAVAPAPTKALYFVSRNDGSHEFSASLTAHNRAVRKYQKRRWRRRHSRSER